MLQYFWEKRDGDIWRVDAVGVRGIQPIKKCKDRGLEYISKRRDTKEWRVDAVDVIGMQPIK